MSEQRRIYILIAIMTAISLLITGFTIFFLYQASLGEEKERLVETVESQARIIEAMARFDAVHSQSFTPGGARAATLWKISEAHNNYEQAGRTMEYALAEKKGEWISFLIRHRHGGLEEYLTPVGFDSEHAVAMRQALLGKSGTIIAEDYRGEVVLAAYEPVSTIGLGIVAKIDLAEIRDPYIRAGLWSGLFAVLIVGIGATLFVRISHPMIDKINEQNETLSKANKSLQQEISERLHAEEELKKAHDELELKVKHRTLKLSETNTLLKREIHERKVAERGLKKNETMLKKIFDGILDPLILLDRNMMVMMLNKAAVDYYHVTNLNDVIGKVCYREIKGELAPCEGCTAPASIANGQYASLERQGLMDAERFENVTMYPILDEEENLASLIIRISDITERKLFERQLIHKEKMASLGVMVSSMAHEINNPNNFISFNIPILREYIQQILPIVAEYADGKPDFEICNLSIAEFQQDISSLIDNIENGSKRINSLVSNLRAYSHEKNELSRINVELKYVIDSVLSICHSKIDRSVKSFIKNIPDHLPTVKAHPYAIEQILINLLTNATQAANDNDSWIQLDVTVDGDEQKYIHIDVSDNGSGMDAQTQSKIFDPFFTTKAPEHGTGLGLFVSHTLAERMNGRIEVESQPGKGSRFRLVMPLDI